jgi:UDP-2-acetamido-2,6-beta-L-arabino-hexul-4-ose reductase
MPTVLVTGAEGFIGKNLRARLGQDKDLDVLCFDRDNKESELAGLVKQADFVFHLAGINRPTDESEFDTGNRGLTEQLLEHISASGKQIPVLITSSIQAELDNPYGRSKKAAEEAVAAWAKDNDAPAYIFRLPNVFGKWCRPNYNSVVATFCNNIATGQEITINDPSAAVTLAYIDDVVETFYQTYKGAVSPGKDGFCAIERTATLTLQELADKLYAFRDSRETLVMPDFAAPFDRFLYATFTSYFDTKDFSYPLDMKTDDRGWLAEFIKSPHFGQVFVSRTKPGISRGNHWHHTKIEKFFVVAGSADITFRLYGSDEILTYSVSGDKLEVVDIPAGYVHAITNTGDTDLITLFWSDEILDPNHPDTYYEEVTRS